MAGETQTTGSCLCGAVRVSIDIENRNVDACHCSMCRKWTGGPLLALECGEDVQFEGEGQIAVYSSSDWAERGFCKQCGSHLFYRLKAQGHYVIPVGLLDQTDGWVFHQQIFIDEKPGFYAFANDTRNLTGAEVFELFGAESD